VVDITELGHNKQEKKEVWRATWDGENDTRPYVSVNATTIDFKEDFDLRGLTEEESVQYLDDRTEPEETKKEARWGRPHYGGSY
jgi:topoisomerase IA-like protein